jgi:hypothetical protein
LSNGSLVLIGTFLESNVNKFRRCQLNRDKPFIPAAFISEYYLFSCTRQFQNLFWQDLPNPAFPFAAFTIYTRIGRNFADFNKQAASSVAISMGFTLKSTTEAKGN